MNIDKFGHHVHKRLRVPESQDLNKWFQYVNGEFDLHLTRLKGIKSPTTADDAVNKEYVDTLLKRFCTREEIAAELQKVKKDILLLLKQQLETKQEVKAHSLSKIIQK